MPSGVPDVIFLHRRPFGRLYVAVGDPGVIDVIDVETMRREEVGRRIDDDTASLLPSYTMTRDMSATYAVRELP